MGLRLERFRQWWEVIQEGSRGVGVAGWVRMVVGMVKVAWRGRSVVRRGCVMAEWRRKMRVCRVCPVFDRTLRRCGPWSGAPTGCGCWVPLLALFDGRCWADEHVPEEGIGWETCLGRGRGWS